MQSQLSLITAPQDAEESCHIEGAAGVAGLLAALAQARAHTAVYLDDEAFVTTTLIGVDGATLLFEPGPDAGLNSRFLEASALTFVTADAGIPVQFSCAGPARPAAHGALAIAVPGRVLRLQRRNYYRLPGEPVHAAMKCEISCETAGGPGVLTPVVLDLSIAGLAAAAPAEAPVLAAGTRTACAIDLPGLGRIEATVEVRSDTLRVLAQGQQARRYGLAFVNMNARQVALIQRYIAEQQRARRRLETAVLP